MRYGNGTASAVPSNIMSVKQQIVQNYFFSRGVPGKAFRLNAYEGAISSSEESLGAGFVSAPVFSWEDERGRYHVIGAGIRSSRQFGRR